MSHIAHLWNQFESMKTFEWNYDYIYYKIGPVVQAEEIFKFCECTFAILLVSPNIKRCGLSIQTNLNSLYLGMLFAKFGWNWPSGSTCNYLPLEIWVVLHLNKLMYPSTKDDLCLVWLKLAQLFWRRRFFKILNLFSLSLFRNYLPFEIGEAPSLIEIDPVVLEKKMKMWKVYDNLNENEWEANEELKFAFLVSESSLRTNYVLFRYAKSTRSISYVDPRIEFWRCFYINYIEINTFYLLYS